MSIAATALSVGARLRRYKETTRTGLLLGVMAVWASFGAVWPCLQLVGDIMASPPSSTGINELVALAKSFALQAAAGAGIGAIGGGVGGGAAMALCVEARS